MTTRPLGIELAPRLHAITALDDDNALHAIIVANEQSGIVEIRIDHKANFPLVTFLVPPGSRYEVDLTRNPIPAGAKIGWRSWAYTYLPDAPGTEDDEGDDDL